MDKIAELDSYFQEFMTNLSDHIPDGIIDVDLKFLQKLGLLHEELGSLSSPSLTRYFHVVESKDKITLFNDQFSIWVVPEKINDEPFTLVLVAINVDHKPKLELGYATSGIYNSSRLVLRILEKVLHEVQETEELISLFEEEPHNPS